MLGSWLGEGVWLGGGVWLGEGVSWGGFSCSFALTSLFLRLGAILWVMMGSVEKIDLRDWFCSTGFQCFRITFLIHWIESQ